jgi:hypothetical protein
VIKSRKTGYVGNLREWDKGKVLIGLCFGSLREGGLFENLCVHEKIILKCIFRKLDEEAWTGLIFLRLGTGGGVL